MKKLLVFLIIFSIFFLISLSITGQVNSQERNAKYASREVLVVFNPKTTLAQRQAAIRSVNAKTKQSFYVSGLLIRRIKVKKGSVASTIRKLSKNPNVKAADNNAVGKGDWVPNDPYYASGALNSFQWNLSRINIANAWDITRGKGVKIAVVDSGLKKGLSDINYNNVLRGYDFYNLDNNPTDDNGHGSHVTGIIAQATNNGIGPAGIAPDVKILPVKVLGSDNEGLVSTFIKGVKYAAARSHVINFSISFDKKNDVAKAVFDKIYNKGTPIIASAGNDSKTSVAYPAAYSSLISVAATDYNNVISYYSNRGRGLDLSAPGGDVTKDLNGDGYADGILQQTFGGGSGPGGGYILYQGTSMAAPHISGVAALLISQGVKGARNIKRALTITATDIGTAGYDTTYGHGLVNAAAALNYPKSTLSLKVSKRKIVYRNRIKVSGTVTPARATRIRIQSYDRRKTKWSTVAKTTSRTNGSYSKKIRPSRNSIFRAYWNGTSSVLGQMSKGKRVYVKPRIRVKAKRVRNRKGVYAMLNGTVIPNHRRRIAIIKKKVGRRWRRVGRVRLNRRSRYRIALKLNRRGLYKLRVYFSDSDHLKGASKTVRVRGR